MALLAVVKGVTGLLLDILGGVEAAIIFLILDIVSRNLL